jgi:AraC-like DNA-binding protein
MNKQSKENYAATFNRFIEDSKVKNPGEMSDILNDLHRYESSLKRLNTAVCERELTENDEKKTEMIERKVKEIAEQLGFNFYINDDPRGYAIRFYLPSKHYNSWDGETWGINW